MKTEPSDIAASAVSGTCWNAFGAVASSLCSLAVGILLARILGPRPYAQVIIASTIYGFVNLFVDGGLGQALIQKPVLDEREIRRTFTSQVTLGAKITVVVCMSAPWIARQFHDPSAAPVIRAMSFMILIQAFGLISSALLRRRMRFKAIQFAAIASMLFGNVLVSLPLALAGYGVWSLVAGGLCQCGLNSLLVYAAARHSLVPRFGLPARSTTTYGSTIVANNLVNWGHANLDNLAASQLGPLALGLYGRGCNFAYQPVNAVASALQPVLLSTAARIADRRKQIADLTLSAMAIVLGVLGSAYTVLALVPDTTIVGLFGDKWAGVIPLMLPFAIAMPFYAIHCLLGPIVCGLGRPALEFWPQATSCAVAAVAFFVAARHSITAVAWVLAAVMLFRCALLSAFVLRLLEIRWRRIVHVLAPRLAFAVAFGGLAWSADQILRSPFHLSAGTRLAVLAVFCGAILSASVWTAGEFIFGPDAIAFLRAHERLLPPAYARQLRLPIRRGTTCPVPAGAAVNQEALSR